MGSNRSFAIISWVAVYTLKPATVNLMDYLRKLCAITQELALPTLHLQMPLLTIRIARVLALSKDNRSSGLLAHNVLHQ